jgi:hypothetical protein
LVARLFKSQLLCHSAKTAEVRVVVEIEVRVGMEIEAHVGIAHREIEVRVRHGHRETAHREIEVRARHGHRETARKVIAHREIEVHAPPGQWVIDPRAHRVARSPLRVRRRRVPQLQARP